MNDKPRLVQPTERQKARLTFALGILERQRDAVGKACDALREMVDGKDEAAWAEETVRNVAAEMDTAEKKAREAERQQIRARLGLDDPTTVDRSSEQPAWGKVVIVPVSVELSLASSNSALESPQTPEP